MVVRFGLNQQREIALAKQRLEQNGVEVKGAIFNGVQKRTGGHYAYTLLRIRPEPSTTGRQEPSRHDDQLTEAPKRVEPLTASDGRSRTDSGRTSPGAQGITHCSAAIAADHDVAVLRAAPISRAIAEVAAVRATRPGFRRGHPAQCLRLSAALDFRGHQAGDVRFLAGRTCMASQVPFQVPRLGKRTAREAQPTTTGLGRTYHRLLCEAVSEIHARHQLPLAAAERRQGFHHARHRGRRCEARHHVHHLPRRSRGKRSRFGALRRAHARPATRNRWYAIRAVPTTAISRSPTACRY